MKCQLSARRRCVDVFRERVQLDTSLIEQSRGIEQLPDGTGEPVQFPNNHDIAFTSTLYLLEGIDLEVGLLVVGRNAGITNFHGA